DARHSADADAAGARARPASPLARPRLQVGLRAARRLRAFNSKRALIGGSRRRHLFLPPCIHSQAGVAAIYAIAGVPVHGSATWPDLVSLVKSQSNGASPARTEGDSFMRDQLYPELE